MHTLFAITIALTVIMAGNMVIIVRHLLLLI